MKYRLYTPITKRDEKYNLKGMIERNEGCLTDGTSEIGQEKEFVEEGQQVNSAKQLIQNLSNLVKQ